MNVGNICLLKCDCDGCICAAELNGEVPGPAVGVEVEAEGGEIGRFKPLAITDWGGIKEAKRGPTVLCRADVNDGLEFGACC